ncbi:hypothetical protein EDB85DRAFT_2160831 [Lactarius pseudohatsudake]|nr:hypothetical protein EDB85DRAFT_2160831 [Lactarius pseudohatsudake]
MAGTMLPPQGLEQPFSLPLLLSPPSPSFPTPPSRIDRRRPLRTQISGTQCPPPPGLLLPSPPSACTPFARKGGARGHVAPGPSLGRTALYRATRPPTPPFPIRAGAHEGTPLRIASAPSRSLFAPPRSREKGAPDPPTPPFSIAKGARKGTRHAPHDPTLPIRAEGARTRDSPFPLAAPLRTRGQGAREAKPPHPVAPHSRRKGRTRPPASLRVAQQDRRRLHVPTFTAPAPRFRAPLYDLDKK